MSATNKENNNIRYDGHVTVVKDLKSHANDPFVLKKLEEANAIMSKVKFPENLKK
ncbi:hypothetical protein IDJ77_03760 [Mucilaginibacter sp. ZT4R22]|uniref:Uncharacterized protein n=1 Tax=Mucilaginibacter pankratovii TaxID=2772110 RepID=A0ABR7WL60_9SPHI|nr:hypothetical protein [Mucilaginibacter pankratovii]MBD1362916.1 hypothetical protein [Mucilaginibacter pankratovii]